MQNITLITNDQWEEIKQALERITALEKKLDALLDDDEQLTTYEAMQRYKVSERTLQVQRDKGSLPFTKHRNKILFSKKQLDKIFLAR